jgi:hypothetical protein
MNFTSERNKPLLVSRVASVPNAFPRTVHVFSLAFIGGSRGFHPHAGYQRSTFQKITDLYIVSLGPAVIQMVTQAACMLLVFHYVVHTAHSTSRRSNIRYRRILCQCAVRWEVCVYTNNVSICSSFEPEYGSVDC